MEGWFKEILVYQMVRIYKAMITPQPKAVGVSHVPTSGNRTPETSSSAQAGEWEKELIKKLGSIKIDHTDFDDDGFNTLCSEEINKIIDIFDQFLHPNREEVIREIDDKIKGEVRDGWISIAYCTFKYHLSKLQGEQNG